MKKGFTLIELLVVIAIIGLLASIVYVSLGSAKKNARASKSIAELEQVRKALEIYYVDNGSYPSSGGNWDGYYSAHGDSLGDNWIPALVPNYMSKLPREPLNTTDGTRQYIYYSNGADYKLIWHVPEDCNGVKSKYPSLIDPARDCWGYGYWSPGGAGI